MGENYRTCIFLFLFAILLGLSPGATDVIIDNGDPGTSFTGTWDVSSGTGAWGTDSLWGRENATYTWTTDQLDPGTYEVFMWWTEYESRNDAAPVQIVHADGTETLAVNQQTSGSQWNSLGVFYFDGTGSVTITGLGVFPTNTCADAVRFTKVIAPPEEVIIDNTDANTSMVGTWPVSGGENPYGDDSVYCRTTNCSFSWYFTPAESGFYRVYMWWTEFSSRSSVTPVEIQNLDGTDAITVNQQTNGGKWNLLGEYEFTEGATYLVTVRTLADRSAVCADAVRFVKTASPPPDETIVYDDGQTHEISTLVINDIEVYDGPSSQPTTLNIAPSGEIGAFNPEPTFNGVSVNQHSILNIRGTLNWGFGASGDSQVNIYSGSSHGFSAAGNSRVDIYDGSIYTTDDPYGINWVTLAEQAQVYLHGGSITGHVVINEDSRFIINGGTGTIDDGCYIEAHDQARVEMNGGSLNLLECYETAQAVIRGGAPENVEHYGTGTIEIYGTAFNLPFGEVAALSGTVTGTLQNGELINVAFTRASGSKIILIEFSASDEVIIDNTDASTSMVGSWPVSGGEDPYGADSVYCRAPDCSFSWLFTPEEDGYYQVSMWWTEFSSRSAAVPVEIQSHDTVASSTVNQQTNGGQWNLLNGEHLMYAGTTYSVTVRTLTDNSSVCADAVRFIKTSTTPPPPPPPPSGLIIDNTDANTSRVGTWEVSGAVNPYGVDSLWCRRPDSSFTWRFTPDEAGYYDVSMWWTEFASRSTAAPVEIVSNDGIASLTVNQQTDGGKWNLLGTYYFNEGVVYSVTVRTLTDNTTVCADAVRLEKSDSPPPPSNETIIDNTSSATEHVGTWPVSGAPDPYGTNSVYCRQRDCSFTWLFTPEKTAWYEVAMWWTVLSSRSSAAPVEIESDDGTRYLTVDQLNNGGTWNVLDKFQFAEGTTYRVTIRTLTDNSSISADAVRFTETIAPPPHQPTGVFIDNRDANTEMVGTWPVSGGLNPYGTDSVYCRDPECSFTWLFTPGEDGYYDVYMYWTDSISRSTAAPVEIENVDGTAHLTVDQMTNCAVWNRLGEYPFYAGTTYRITIHTLTDNSSVCADAVCFEKTATPPPPPPPPPSGIIIDNTDPNTSMVGTWPVSGGINPWGEDSVYCRAADCSFTWLFTPSKSGFYQVDMWWTEFSSRSTVTPVEIQHNGGTAFLTVNQQTGGNTWNPLGAWFFDAGTTYSVTIRTLADRSAVCADAVRFEETEIVVPDTIIDNRDSETVTVGTWPASGGENPYSYDSVYCRYSGCSFTWQFTPQFAGRYEVSMWWTAFTSRSTAAPVTVEHADGTASMTVNQQTDGGQWNLLGDYLFEAGVTYDITIRTLTDRSTICADAVKLVKVPD